ncbi:hypothetical protein ACF0H5_017093 [Mactra antiquata]
MWIICENIRGFVSSRPPLILFMLSLGIFAVALLTIGYIVKVNEIKNPDDKDWNDFLSGFNNVQFCMKSDDNNTTESEHIGDQNYKEVLDKVHSKLKGDYSTSTVTPRSGDILTVSVPVWVEVKPTLDFVSIPHNVTHLSTRMNGKQMGLEGDHANTDFNVTFTLPYQWNSSLCQSNSDCKVIHIRTCVNMIAPINMFPNARKMKGAQCMTTNSSGIENHYTMISKKKSEVRPVDIVCDSMTSFTVKHKDDPSLTIYLTLQDRSAINLHLMHTSYFLFVMVLMIMCYGLVRGKPGNVKVKNNVHYSEVSTQV